MDSSPFPYQGPLEASQVRGRDELVRDLTERVTERRVTALLGPRRYGKTSVLRRVAADLSEVTAVWVDLYEVTSMADVAVRFDEALAETSGRFAEAARRIAATASLTLGAIKVEFTRPARVRPEPSITFHSLLDVLVRAALRSPTLLVVDEFSSISRVPGAAGALRTALQHHYQELGIVFAGSHPSMMRSLFTDRPEPFYGQADLVSIAPLSVAAVEEVVTSGFSSTGRNPGRLASLIFGFTSGHPQRAMQLADAAWRRTEAGTTAGADEWAQGLADVRRSTAEGMERIYSAFDDSERTVLRAVAQAGSIYGTEAALLNLSAGAASRARQKLVDGGDLVDTASGLNVVDPLLSDWIRQRFPL